MPTFTRGVIAIYNYSACMCTYGAKYTFDHPLVYTHVATCTQLPQYIYTFMSISVVAKSHRTNGSLTNTCCWTFTDKINEMGQFMDDERRMGIKDELATSYSSIASFFMHQQHFVVQSSPYCYICKQRIEKANNIHCLSVS